ncbi:microtubule-associated tumor suppressor 1 homolog A-like [Anoplophora glabripennis]|uniref:microtubule-associated tumor suppressor 1 homolog A-like n=1 Tax=Anoplophora glabripennis TaxID=217634 RepID=UPI000874B31D|nr:microtubule-associated tumor suppressor 1 homolog A-like [Anoplophora glabripennis]
MDPNLQKAIQDYKEKQKNSGAAVDCVELERCFREFKTELYIKRDEVNQQRTELDAANLEIQNLRRALDVTKKTLDENQFNLNIQLKKASNNEEQLKKMESLMKIQLQHKMAITEIDTLKENLQKTEMEKLELTRKVDVLEAKQRHSSMYYNEILKRDNQLRNIMTNLDEMAVKLQAEHIQAIELSKKNQLANDALQKLKVCVEENEKLRKQKEKFEEMYVKVNEKIKKLEESLQIKESENSTHIEVKEEPIEID